MLRAALLKHTTGRANALAAPRARGGRRGDAGAYPGGGEEGEEAGGEDVPVAAESGEHRAGPRRVRPGGDGPSGGYTARPGAAAPASVSRSSRSTGLGRNAQAPS